MKQCLIVDDSSSIRKVAKRILKDFGYEAAEAENGEEALKLCAESMPDSIIVDWQMPDVDSTRLMADIRKLPDGNKPTILYCTLENDPMRMAAAIRHGANGQLMKPFDREALTRSLSSVGLIDS
jgi:two-component system chemotaxis response regulator CheY